MQLDGHAGDALVDLEIAALSGCEGDGLPLGPAGLVRLPQAGLPLVTEPARVALDVKRLHPLARLALNLIRPVSSMLVLPLVPVDSGHFFVVLDGEIGGGCAPAVHNLITQVQLRDS